MNVNSQKDLVLVTLLLLVSSMSAAQGAELILRERAIRSGGMIRLGDVADISAATPEVMHDLSTTPLMPAPAPGTSQFLRRDALYDLLISRGIDVKQLFIGGAQVIEVGDARPERSKIGQQQPQQAAQSRKPEPKKPALKNAEPKKVEQPHQKTVVTLRKIEVGDLVRRSDVELREHPGKLSANALTSLDEVIGMQTLRTFSEGAVVRKNQLRAPLQVRRGETVTIFARTGGISVKTFAIAKQDGAQGDLIQLQTLDKKQQYAAHVSGRRELEVLATGNSARELATLDRQNSRR